MIVYKYLVFDRIDVLKNSAIRFSPAAILNDPFESRPNYTEYRAQILERLKTDPSFNTPRLVTPLLQSIAQSALDDFHRVMGEFMLILSLTKRNNNALMWSHYTSDYKGFVIGFDSECDFFKPGNGKAVDGLKDVKYSAKRAMAPKNGLAALSPEEAKAANEAFFFTKSEDWAYEEEVRILANAKKADLVPTKIDGFDVCLFKFRKECVKEIILGPMMDPAKKQEFVDLVAAEYPHVKLFEATLSETEFDLDINPLAF
jgi:hypothetical protein